MKAETQYWIVAASKDQVTRVVGGGFMQANHGKGATLKRLNVGDWVLFYSPEETYEGKEPLQAFTAIGKVTAGEIYQHNMKERFTPYRRNVQFYDA